MADKLSRETYYLVSSPGQPSRYVESSKVMADRRLRSMVNGMSAVYRKVMGTPNVYRLDPETTKRQWES